MRRFPGTLALGLLTAYFAHTVLYGNDHTMGGSYSCALRALALTGALGLGGFWLAICLVSGGRLCQGSVLTAGMRRLVPSLAGMFAASFGWFGLAESVEHGHAWAPTWCNVVGLLAAAAIVRLLAVAGLRALAKIVFFSDSGAFENRAPSWTPIGMRPPARLPVVLALRLFSRPPPIRFIY